MVAPKPAVGQGIDVEMLLTTLSGAKEARWSY